VLGRRQLGKAAAEVGGQTLALVVADLAHVTQVLLVAHQEDGRRGPVRVPESNVNDKVRLCERQLSSICSGALVRLTTGLISVLSRELKTAVENVMCAVQCTHNYSGTMLTETSKKCTVFNIFTIIISF